MISVVLPSLVYRGNLVDPQLMQERLAYLQQKREVLVQLLEQPDLGTLRIDVNQALEEMDDLLEEFQRTFPSAS